MNKIIIENEEISKDAQESIHLSAVVSSNISVQTLNNSIKPSIEEIERFIIFLSNKFSLWLKNDLIVNIQATNPSTKGFFMPNTSENHYENDITALNYICISSLFLKNNPYETIAHELAHYINQLDGHNCKCNYHTKHFKIIAEKLLLKVEKGTHGFNITNETPEFKALLSEFSPDKNAFIIFQNHQDKEKKSTRNLLYTCSCGVKIRSAKNEDKPLKAICGYCNSEFMEMGK
jgi:predicted SprT family Zn-dependent metalloprotease